MEGGAAGAALNSHVCHCCAGTILVCEHNANSYQSIAHTCILLKHHPLALIFLHQFNIYIAIWDRHFWYSNLGWNKEKNETNSCLWAIPSSICTHAQDWCSKYKEEVFFIHALWHILFSSLQGPKVNAGFMEAPFPVEKHFSFSSLRTKGTFPLGRQMSAPTQHPVLSRSCSTSAVCLLLSFWRFWALVIKLLLPEGSLHLFDRCKYT